MISLKRNASRTFAARVGRTTAKKGANKDAAKVHVRIDDSAIQLEEASLESTAPRSYRCSKKLI